MKLKFILVYFLAAAFAFAAQPGAAAGRPPKLDAGENPLVPMFAANGKPSNDELSGHLKAFKDAGITQFLIYPRTGCELEYMGAEWLGAVKFMAGEAKRLGFTSVWLYDEFDWPSGTANKEVMRRNPSHALRQLSAFKNPDGSIGFEIASNPNMADLLNPESVKSFINLTHEKYYALLKDDFGGIIRGIFSDEPSIRYFKKDARYIRTIPYYDGLEEDYQKLAGGSLRGDIERGIRTGSEPYAEILSKLLGARFRASYIDSITAWASAHGIFSTGHFLSESSPRASIESSGHLLDVLPGLTLPAVDEILTHSDITKFEWLTFGCEAYAAEKNGNGGMAELFALGPSDMPLARARRQIWLAAAFGVNRYLLAISQTDLRVKISKDKYLGASMTGWLSSWSPSQPWFGDLRVLGEDAKKAARFAMKKRDAAVGVVYPHKIADLNSVLCALVDSQISWKLLREEDKPGAERALRVGDCGNAGIVCEGASSRNIFATAKILRSLYPERPRVLEQNGALAKDIFVQPYKDGSAIIVNFTDDKRDLVFARDGKKTPFTLYPAGVVALEKGEQPAREAGTLSPAPAVKWSVSLDSPNTIRPTFHKTKRFDFELKDDMELVFALRNFGSVGEFSLDGEKLDARGACSALPAGFRPLYKQFTARVKKGKHVLALENGAIEYMYLPLVLIAGDFSADGSVLRKYAGDGAGLAGYVGKISQKAQVDLPADASRVEFDTRGLVAELFLDGKSLGTRLWAPFSWEIPRGMRGKKARVELARRTSLGRAFGDVEKMPPPANKWVLGFYKEYFPDNRLPIEPAAEMFFRRGE